MTEPLTVTPSDVPPHGARRRAIHDFVETGTTRHGWSVVACPQAGAARPVAGSCGGVSGERLGYCYGSPYTDTIARVRRARHSLARAMSDVRTMNETDV